MAELGELIKQKRLALKWSLRQLGAALGVTGAYVADIEANRRLPGPDLTERISSVLDIPSEELAAADYRLSTDLREWIEERPQLGTLLRSLRSSPESDMLIQRLTRFFNRRSPPQIPRGFLVTWESESARSPLKPRLGPLRQEATCSGGGTTSRPFFLQRKPDQAHSVITHTFVWTWNTSGSLAKRSHRIGLYGISVTGTPTTA